MDDWLFDNFSHSHDSFLNDWNLNDLFNFLHNFSVLDHYPVSDHFHFFDSFVYNDLFSNNWNFVRLSDNRVGLNDFFHDLRHFDNFFNGLNDWNWLFDDSVDDLMSDFNVVFNFLCISVLDLSNYLLDNFLNFNDLWNLDNLFNDLLHNNWDFNDLFNDLWLRLHDYFLYNYNFLDLDLDIVLNSFNFDDFFNFNEFFDNLFDSHNLWNFLDDFNNSFNNLRYFNDSFNDLFNCNNLLNDVSDDDWHLKRYIYDSFDFLNSFNFDNFLSDFLDSDNLWDFNDSFDNLFDDFFDFNNFGDDSENFEDVIDINNAHDFLSDHSNDAFVHFENNASSEFDLFELFEKGLDEDSQMEFNFSGLFA